MTLMTSTVIGRPEDAMRITLHLDTFDTDPFAYAILWLDDQTLKWSREGHAGLALPEWGTLRT